MSEATRYYEQREEVIGPELSRDIERQVMLRLIDQHWRDHLYEMDYLREGIHLRAYGQKDPAVEWQREGFDMFAQMMSGIADDFVKYIMHVQVAVEPAPQAQITNVQYSAPEDPVQGTPAIVVGTRRRGSASAHRRCGATAGGQVRMGQDPAQRTVSVWERQEVQTLPRQVTVVRFHR